jgi:hypothetical protein
MHGTMNGEFTIMSAEKGHSFFKAVISTDACNIAVRMLVKEIFSTAWPPVKI